MKKITYSLALLFISIFANAQTNILRFNANIMLPKDSIESKKLTTSLNDFLVSAQKSNEENKFIYEPEKLETFILLDEINGIEKSAKYKDDFFFKPYLTNAVMLKDSTYLIQVSYIGVNDNLPILRASFEFIAHKTNITFTYSSPLIRNTKNWKVEKAGSHIFHYQYQINKDKVKEYNKVASFVDNKLNIKSIITDYYCTDNIVELQKLIGVDYKSDYNGRLESIWSSSLGDKKLVVYGNANSSFNEFDPHDLFHNRLSLVISRSKTNRPVDEGCAYLYGGSWGYTWKEIFKEFDSQIASNKNINWTEIKETPVQFKTGKYSNSADYIVNALLVKKIEKEKGFAGVWELLTIGPFEKGNEKYYQTLEKLIGISKANYNEKVWELIKAERN